MRPQPLICVSDVEASSFRVTRPRPQPSRQPRKDKVSGVLTMRGCHAGCLPPAIPISQREPTPHRFATTSARYETNNPPIQPPPLRDNQRQAMRTTQPAHQRSPPCAQTILARFARWNPGNYTAKRRMGSSLALKRSLDTAGQDFELLLVVFRGDVLEQAAPRECFRALPFGRQQRNAAVLVWGVGENLPGFQVRDSDPLLGVGFQSPAMARP
jgi:hypothetical protein